MYCNRFRLHSLLGAFLAAVVILLGLPGCAFVTEYAGYVRQTAEEAEPAAVVDVGEENEAQAPESQPATEPEGAEQPDKSETTDVMPEGQPAEEEQTGDAAGMAADEPTADAVALRVNVEPEPELDPQELAAIRVDRDFSQLDAAVRALPEVDSVEATAEQLAALASDDWERARAIFVWMTENIRYDTAAFFSGMRAVTDPDGVFRTGRSVCQGYAQLAAQLGALIGLEMTVVSGYSKGYGYREGRGFSDTNHAWNAFHIDGAWHQFDSTWGAGYVSGRQFVKEYGAFWFDPHPELFLRTHLPADDRWQLIVEPITMEEYIDQPYVESATFENLHDIGFGDEAVLAALADDAGLPAAHSFAEYPIEIIEAPLQERLPIGEEVFVALRVEGATEGAFVNNGGFTFLTFEDGILSGSVVPERGQLRVSARIHFRGRTSYWTVLEYRVW
jgi:hypothetical protein